ncbi:efflux transporter outer membrane subunit [Serpentinimonas barnesii]|uniref:efflux transporter outer membrane subunit n=1 Tax=Serpentinimonas barnesii TaxID=1458427 RepID=UPI000694FE25|nr:efflux transporter outer membrane subunit [Serpentinimonas barnesii]
MQINHFFFVVGGGRGLGAAVVAALLGLALSGCAWAPAASAPAAGVSVTQALGTPLAADWRNPWPEGAVPAQAPEQTAPALPAPAQAYPAPAELAHWWRAFDDPALSALIEQSLQAHTSVRAAEAALQQARALNAISLAGQGPQLQASASAQRAQAGQGSAASAWRAGLDASWELDWFGQRRMAEAATAAEVQAASAQFGHVRVSLAAEVALNYLEWRALQQRLGVVQRRLALQEEFVQIVGWRVQAGLMSGQDLEQARLNLAQLRATLPELQAGLGQAEAALAVLSGRPPQTALNLPASGIPVAGAALARAIPADTLLQRPDVQRAQARLAAALARSAQADAQRWPTLALGGTLDWRSPRVSDLFDAGALTRTLLLRLVASLYDGGAARAQVQVQQAAAEQVRIELEAAVLTALREVEHALLALQASEQRLQNLTQAAEAAAEVEALALLRLTSGLIDYRIWLDARHNLLTAQIELANARAAWSADHVRLVKALGGGWNAADVQAARPQNDNTP